MIEASRASRHNARHIAVRHKDTIQNRVLAPRGAHAEHIPRLFNAIALGAPRHERMHDLRCVGIARIHAVKAEIGPYRRETSEGLSSCESISTGDAFRLSGREEYRDVVAAFSVSCGEYGAFASFLKKPLERCVT